VLYAGADVDTRGYDLADGFPQIASQDELIVFFLFGQHLSVDWICNSYSNAGHTARLTACIGRQPSKTPSHSKVAGEIMGRSLEIGVVLASADLAPWQILQCKVG